MSNMDSFYKKIEKIIDEFAEMDCNVAMIEMDEGMDPYRVSKEINRLRKHSVKAITIKGISYLVKVEDGQDPNLAFNLKAPKDDEISKIYADFDKKDMPIKKNKDLKKEVIVFALSDNEIEDMSRLSCDGDIYRLRNSIRATISSLKKDKNELLSSKAKSCVCFINNGKVYISRGYDNLPGQNEMQMKMEESIEFKDEKVDPMESIRLANTLMGCAVMADKIGHKDIAYQLTKIANDLNMDSIGM